MSDKKQINAKAVLAIETSGDVCGAAAYFNETKYSEISLRLRNIHSEKILEITEQVLNHLSIKLADLGAIAVSAGPGSFTGLRIGMSTVKGLAFGAGLPITAVPTFDVLAFQICHFIEPGTKFIIANKVNNEEIYYAKYSKAEGFNYSVIDPIDVIKNEVLQEKTDSDVLVFGNFLKSGPSAGVISSPGASFVAKWAYIYGKDFLTFDYDFLEPRYLKNFVIKSR